MTAAGAIYGGGGGGVTASQMGIHQYYAPGGAGNGVQMYSQQQLTNGSALQQPIISRLLTDLATFPVSLLPWLSPSSILFHSILLI